VFNFEWNLNSVIVGVSRFTCSCRLQQNNYRPSIKSTVHAILKKKCLIALQVGIGRFMQGWNHKLKIEGRNHNYNTISFLQEGPKKHSYLKIYGDNWYLQRSVFILLYILNNLWCMLTGFILTYFVQKLLFS
jgi:hypothetical protein